MILEEGAADKDSKSLSFDLGRGWWGGVEGDPVGREGPVGVVGEPCLLEEGDVCGVGV